jgi:hypothetical protein
MIAIIQMAAGVTECILSAPCCFALGNLAPDKSPLARSPEWEAQTVIAAGAFVPVLYPTCAVMTAGSTCG